MPYVLDVVYPSGKQKTYTFSTWEQRSTILKQLPSGTQFRCMGSSKPVSKPLGSALDAVSTLTEECHTNGETT